MSFDISSMLSPHVFDHAVKHIELVETHISYVILTGDYAYKIKKPVNFGFLDFSTLEKRRNCCKQEVCLNRRMADEIYLDVVAITDLNGKLAVSGSGSIVEYAVKMTEFPQACQLDHMLHSGELNAQHMESIARMVAEFHQSVTRSDSYGNAEMIIGPVEENFRQINERVETENYANILLQLQQWSSSEFLKLSPVFEQRRTNGFVRECHGDLHLRNLIWLNGKPMAFDCIEFNPKLRWIDVISDVAFLVMDLHDRQKPQLANRFLNSYLEITGDYAGLSILPFYLCYRAVVRAKVNALRLEQQNISAKEREKIRREFQSYLELASDYTKQSPQRLIIMRGLSGSGKSTVSQALVDVLGAIRIRSDVERKRMFINEADEAAMSTANIYSRQTTEQTYKKLGELASSLIESGYSVIVDATFLVYQQRKQFHSLAKRLGVTYVILETVAPEDVLRQRILGRKHDVSDADTAVFENQLKNLQPLHDGETDAVVSVNTAQELDIEAVAEMIAHNDYPHAG